MERHISIVAALQIALSVLGLIAGIILYSLLFFAGDFINTEVAASIFSIFSRFVIGVIFLMSLPGLIAGLGLLRRKEWARILTLILSVLSLLNFPIGTAIGVYSIWALVHPEVIQQFKKEHSAGAIRN